MLDRLDKIIRVWEANPTFSMGPEVTLEIIKDARAALEQNLQGLRDFKRQITERSHRRDAAAQTSNELTVRARKGILAFFGPESRQYLQAGGTRASDYKLPMRKPRVVPLTKAA